MVLFFVVGAWGELWGTFWPHILYHLICVKHDHLENQYVRLIKKMVVDFMGLGEGFLV